MKDNITRMPPPEYPNIFVGPFEEYRVVLDGRMIPKLTGLKRASGNSLTLDNRFLLENIPDELLIPVAHMIANALAIGGGYSCFSADAKDTSFAPLAFEIKS